MKLNSEQLSALGKGINNISKLIDEINYDEYDQDIVKLHEGFKKLVELFYDQNRKLNLK